MNVTVSGIEALLGLPEDEYTAENIEQLENYIYECQTYLRNEGEPIVADSIYDRLVEILREVKPHSDIFNNIWDEEVDEPATISAELDIHRKSNPMLSIQTVKSWDDKFLDGFIERVSEYDDVELFYAYKLNGHGVRVVYNDGELVKATTRARASAGRDITRQMRNLLGYRNNALDGYGVVEIRGEICVRLSDFGKVKELHPELKSPFSAVAALNKPSSTEEENKLLTFQGYRLFGDDFNFATREEEYQEIARLGFETPKYITELVEDSSYEGILESIQNAFASFEEEDSEGENDFFCDGIVLEMNNTSLHEVFGVEGNRANYNVALKVGRWSQDAYMGYVQTIIWKQGKHKLSPVALVAAEPGIAQFDSAGVVTNMGDMGVMTAQGNTVANIPLYEPKNILILDAYPGNPLHFRYGGEAGVVPQTAEGKLLTDEAVKNLLETKLVYED